MKIALWFLLIVFAVPVRGDAQTPSLVVNYAAINANMLNLWVGKEGGYFVEEGLDVRILHLRGGSLGVQRLVSGQTPVGLGPGRPRRLQPAALIDSTVVRDAAK